MLNLMRSGTDDPEMAEVAKECRQQSHDLFVQAALQEKEWAEYLFKDGSMIGLNRDILCQYVEYITNIRMRPSIWIRLLPVVPIRFHGSMPGWYLTMSRWHRRRWKSVPIWWDRSIRRSIPTI